MQTELDTRHMNELSKTRITDSDLVKILDSLVDRDILIIVLETFPRCCRSSFDRNSPSSRALTILKAAFVPRPGIALNGGINEFPSIINSFALDRYKSTV